MKNSNGNNSDDTPFIPHTLSATRVLDYFNSSPHGLTSDQANERLQKFGTNTLPEVKPTSLSAIFLHQFASPLIYILLAAAALSIVIQQWSDATFIGVVLVVNAIIGTVQEYSAQRAASALQKLVKAHCKVVREGDTYELDAHLLVPGDIVLLESGDRIPADIRLCETHDLEIDESLLTGESAGILKDASPCYKANTFLGERRNMAFAGTLVNRGRGRGVVSATGLNSELGDIAASVLSRKTVRPPLLVRMEEFNKRVAIIMGILSIVLASLAFAQGMTLTEIFLLTVALAVAAIPEGLPVALTVALAMGMRRMATRNVIIRKLLAVEALGSCTYIATDKTGTLTVNQLTVKQVMLPDNKQLMVSGEGSSPDGTITDPDNNLFTQQAAFIKKICMASVLPNDAFTGQRQGEWVHHGDAVDVALLIFARKAGVIKTEAELSAPVLASIPFESERLFTASLNQVDGQQTAYVKGALEKLIPMCASMATMDKDIDLDAQQLTEQAHALAEQGFRILALASGPVTLSPAQTFTEECLHGLTLLGLVAMIDPLRPDAVEAVRHCQQGGIRVSMVTGDHPATALAIAKQLGLASDQSQIVTGPQLYQATSQSEFDRLTSSAKVFARVEPHQKLDIVQSLQRQGHYVAVSGDGANDAPALKAAHVGIAMGKSGTDVARETASMIITDDRFSSIVAGIEEGRIAYANVRKVIFLVITTGIAELILFTLTMLTAQPVPLLAVQLLWLNLVTNGIQDVALAFEPAEGDELKRPPRSPQEAVFNRAMVERVILSALTIGVVAFATFQWLLNQGFSIDDARNCTVLLMVLFENMHAFNSRSETRSVFTQNPFSNPLLLFSIITAQLVHVAAMHIPWLANTLHLKPVSFELWLQMLTLSLGVLLVMEIYKAVRKKTAYL